MKSKSQVSLVLLTLLIIAGCAPAVSYPAPSPAAPTPTPTPFAGPEALPDAPTPIKGPLPLEGLPGQFIFVEVQEERVTKSSGQTTTFAGEQVTYSFNPETGVLKGVLQGALNPDTQVIVGRLIINQINQNKAVSGQLYALTPELLLPIAFTAIEPNGTVCFTYEGQEHCLQPGQDISFQMQEAGGGELEAGQTSRTLIVINHGLLNKVNLQ
ncbi:MAG: hypothetical protein NUW24_14770 [Anaerolineae bacterium]|jgi:hypothetical protein|nr:hypothetical protein [Anaerolineae bacterium]MDH7474386.1 hypothetical protein [Anaerolineae bacterium]